MINSNGLEVNTFCENMFYWKKESGKVYTVVEDLCVEDTNVFNSCVQFFGDYKRPDLFDWIVKVEVVYGLTLQYSCNVKYKWSNVGMFTYTRQPEIAVIC